jgi:hypothetical protein
MNEQTTVTIDRETARKLERLAQQTGQTKKDFLSLSLDYFEKHGINPVTHETPIQEMERLRKRLDQVIAFIRTQEKDKVNPMFEAITATEVRIKNDLDTIAKQQDVRELIDSLNRVLGSIQTKAAEDRKTAKDETGKQYQKTAKALERLAECLETGKDRKGLTGIVKNILGI